MARQRFEEGHEIRVRGTSELQKRLAALAKFYRRTTSDMLRVLIEDAYTAMRAHTAKPETKTEAP